ncbi:hypothetical protein TMatcc_001247 [Talaromyces marneffei ATCC 18224]|uniref:Uncharacterized protein n=1 Tax=Talaromyces marneffei (strain ATCC 18224 / CBS 334.59 / QM 7333) TaxID=441960 RepID=B6QGA2_TALMQ|nr:uncharacterized protein EYB26_003740 [Talaromyces marneffei]EEA18466.1 hypothetical protein PMAA_102430 [Talaromyces marneffei ATCC 18224]EEA18550.1 hypothetical protein PMAA_008290 [Talaromyces marneffei ATCC 18224]EEA21834.1 hypothetical protein PMAA_056260 [Talaromyces marneffei ATCC 18224]EEA24487.1 hypothetical protein PMAA_084880 [Talaromyces marneffei ATCC 18224]KAE8550142.1 hypothetical protein EYB25_008673 [Talaromyces marneffei]
MDNIEFFQIPNSNASSTPQRGITAPPISTPLPRQSSTPIEALFTPVTPNCETSQTPIAPSIERSQLREASQLRNISSNARGRTLNEDEVLVLFNCALALQDQYNGGKKSFWELVEAQFIIEARHSYSWKSCKSKIEARVRAREAYTQKYETGRETEASTPLDVAIDEWIEFLQEYSEEEKEESAQKTQDILFQQQQVLYRDGLLETMEKAAKRRAQSSQLTDSLESSTSNPGSEDDSEDNNMLTRGSSKASRGKKQKRGQAAFSFEDFMTLHQENLKQDRRLIKSLITPSSNKDHDALAQQVKNISKRVDTLEENINGKFDLILKHLEKRSN